MKIIRKIIVLLVILIGFVSCLTTTDTLVQEGERKKTSEFTVQVINQENTNLSIAELSWLPFQIQDKLNSNVQTYLGMKTIVDTKSENEIKKLQAASEDFGRDVESAIELGKITTAKYALFTKVRKTDLGYVISVDFTDLTTGENLASCLSKEYSKAEYLYGNTGAVDEITLQLAEKLNIQISDLNKNLLTVGSASFTVDEQLALAKQNDAHYKKMMAEYDAELKKLSTSNDINAIQNKNRIEAEKALLLEKQNAEKKRQEELIAQKERLEADKKLENERSIELITQREQLAKQAAEKASEVRKLKLEKQGILGEINVIESKKKALVEIREGVEKRRLELLSQLQKNRSKAKIKIRAKTYSTVELGSDGQPTANAIKRRENQITNSYITLTEKFFEDCAAVENAVAQQDKALISEINTDIKNLSKTRTVHSFGNELKISFGQYEGSQNGWNTYISLYSDGVLLYSDTFILKYENLSGKKVPDMETELNDEVIAEYANNVDMYSSLLTRGEPIICFELDYEVRAANEDFPSLYIFWFDTIRVIDTISSKVVQTTKLNKTLEKTMQPVWDIREIESVVAIEAVKIDILRKNITKEYASASILEYINSYSTWPIEIYFMLKSEREYIENNKRNILQTIYYVATEDEKETITNILSLWTDVEKSYPIQEIRADNIIKKYLPYYYEK